MKDSSNSIPFIVKAMTLDSAKGKEFDAIADDRLIGSAEGETCRCAGVGLPATTQRRGAPGVSSSNTPPQSSKIDTNQASQWVAAEDWFEWSLYVDWGTNWPKLSRRLSTAKEYAAIADCPKDKCSIPYWGGCAVVDRMGARLGHKKSGLYFAYKLQTEFLTIMIAEREEPHKTKPSVIMRASGEACLLEGAKSCYEEGKEFIKEMGGCIIRNKLSRVDACMDMPSEIITPFDLAYFEERYICRARSHGRYASGGITVQFGKYPLMLRIYDKKAEVMKKNNPTQMLGMLINRWDGEIPESSIRVEFELGREFLKKKGVDSVEDYHRKRAALLSYLTHDWMRFTQDQVDRENKNQSKARTLPIWEKIREAFLDWAESDPNVSLAPLDKSKANVSHLIKVVAGVTRTAAKCQGKTIETLEDFSEYLQDRIKLYGVSVKTEQ